MFKQFKTWLFCKQYFIDYSGTTDQHFLRSVYVKWHKTVETAWNTFPIE